MTRRCLVNMHQASPSPLQACARSMPGLCRSSKECCYRSKPPEALYCNTPFSGHALCCVPSMSPALAAGADAGRRCPAPALLPRRRRKWRREGISHSSGASGCAPHRLRYGDRAGLAQIATRAGRRPRPSMNTRVARRLQRAVRREDCACGCTPKCRTMQPSWTYWVMLHA